MPVFLFLSYLLLINNTSMYDLLGILEYLVS
jgi:hypothetical protein